MEGPLYAPETVVPAFGGDPEDLLRDLNPAQRAAVVAPRGPLLVIAGAGTGKTRVLTRRVAWRIATGTPPRSVLAITFTNKAADVLKERLAALPGGDAVTAGTFHAFAASLLRRHADRIGGDRSFTILDADDQRRLLRDLLDRLGVPAREYAPPDFAAAISHEKDGAEGRAPRVLSDERFRVHLERVRPEYDARLRAASLYDFDDLLREACRLFEEDEDLGRAIRARYRHVLVDEYQDTNGVQVRLLRHLAGPDPDVTAVGDPDQSIYRWRGATVRNILGFERDFPGARRVLLEENYRSTARLLAAAEAVISRNRERYEKRLATSNPPGERATELHLLDGAEEADAVAARIARWVEDGVPAREIAVFVRVNHLTRGIETALRARRVPYAVVSGVEFYQRREVKDVLAYARLLANPKDESAFVRVVNVPRRGIGDGTVARLLAHATARGASVPETAHERVDGVGSRARKALDGFLALLGRLSRLPRAPVAKVLEAIVEETGYRAALLSEGDDLERSRVENVEELLRSARDFDRERPDGDLAAFLERASLVGEQDAFDERSGKVSLMTVHAAKGLEFDRVVVLGAEEGWFPHARNAGSPEDVEEERRLFYVALTRARSRLLVTHVVQRDAWRGLEARRPSPFWMDVPDDLVETVDPRGLWTRERERREAAWRRRRLGEEDEEDGARFSPRTGGPVARHDAFGEDGPAPPDGSERAFERAADDVPAPGERVVHPHFGAGRLVARSGIGASLRVTVDFDRTGTKTILWCYARLSREDGGRGGDA